MTWLWRLLGLRRRPVAKRNTWRLDKRCECGDPRCG